MNMNFFRLMILPGFLFLIIIGFGLWVSKVGKPYNNLLFNIHKLIALGAVILTGIRIFKLDPFVSFPNMAILLIALAVLGVIGMFTTGAIMSIKDEVPNAALLIHNVLPTVIFISMTISIYLIILEQLKTL